MNREQETGLGMSAREKRASIALSCIFAFRMLGLFMILPVFALYAGTFQDATPTLTGIAIGAYGLTQALFQIPFGLLSDRYGRKRLITIGLLIFIGGSIVAAQAESIYGIICGRALQGSGAIAAAIMALASDLTRDEHRTKTMAMIGMSIGLSFMVAMIIGPIAGHAIGLSGIFWFAAGLAALAILILFGLVPTPEHRYFNRQTETIPRQLLHILSHKELLRLDYGVFVLHLLMTSTFIVIPLLLRDAALPIKQHWEVYLPALVLSLFVALPMIIVGEKKGKSKTVFLCAIAFIALAELGWYLFHTDLLNISMLLWVFFSGFNLLEATLPSLISKISPADLKGTALGIYSFSQFIGAFCGGAIGGWVFSKFGAEGVFLLGGALAVSWLLVASGMQNPKSLRSLAFKVEVLDARQADLMATSMRKVAGVVEAVVLAEDGMAYLKVDRSALDREHLLRLVPEFGKFF